MMRCVYPKCVAGRVGIAFVRRYFGLGALAICLSVPACADIVLTLTNPSFEIQNPFDQTAGCGSSTPCYNFSIVDWNQFGTSGTFDPSLGVPPIAPPALSGHNVAFLNSSAVGGSYITQGLGTLTAGTTYSISIEVATRGPSGATPQALYRLGAATGGTAAAPTFTTFFQVSGLAPANPLSTSDNWAPVTLVFTPLTTGNWYTYISDDGAIGGGLGQLLVDAVPEPLSLLLLATVIGFLAFFEIKRQKALGFRRFLGSIDS
jgi:hypothetical protein